MKIRQKEKSSELATPACWLIVHLALLYLEKLIDVWHPLDAVADDEHWKVENMTVKDDDDNLIKVLAMIAMTTALVMMMMAVVGGWCFFGWGDAVGSRQRETALYFQLLPKTAGARIHWGAPRQCFFFSQRKRWCTGFARESRCCSDSSFKQFKLKTR